MLGVAVLHVMSIGGPQFTADEGTPWSQALSLVRDGRLSPYTYRYDHAPVGWVRLAPLMGLAQVIASPWSTTTSVRVIMALLAAATAAMVYAVGRSLRLRRRAAMVARLPWGRSPLAAQLSGQLSLDDVGMPWLLASPWRPPGWVMPP